MGDLILLSEHLQDRSRPSAEKRPAFFYDVACPFSYLAADQLERALGDVAWIPVLGSDLAEGTADWTPQVRMRAERLASRLRIPLLWPERGPAVARPALRAAAYAAEVGAGARFGLAVTRLAFCGGFDLDDPEVLGEAAGAARISLESCLAAARDSSRDAPLQATAAGLRSRGAAALPVVRVGTALLQGESVVTEAAVLLRWRASAGAPLAPAG